MKKLKILDEIDNNNRTLTLTGKINEDVSFSHINFDKELNIIFNLQDVSSINSCGIREWINLMKRIPNEINVSFHNCDRIIIEQANMIKGFLPPNSFVKSFYIPYYCDSCDEQTNILINRNEDNPTEINYNDNVTCSNCQKEAEIDVIESKYFKFLTQN